MKNTTRVVIGVVAIIILGFLMNSKAVNDISNEDPNKVIKIGAIYALTGPSAKFGELSVQGANDAVEYFRDINKEFKVDMVVEDSGGDPKQAVSAVIKLFDIDKTKFVVTGTSGVSAAVAPIAEQYKNIVISDAVLYGLTNGKKYVFQNFMPALNDIPEQINKNNDWKKVAIVYINDEFGSVWSKKIADQIVLTKKVENYPFEKNVTDFRTNALKIKQFEPNVIVVLGYGPALNQVLADIQIQKIDTDYISYLACTLPGVLSDKKFSLENTYSYEYPIVTDSDADRWVSAKGRERNTFYNLAFENTLTALTVAVKSNNDPEKAVSLLKNEQINGLYGVIQFDDAGVVNRGLSLTKIKNNKCEFVD